MANDQLMKIKFEARCDWSNSSQTIKTFPIFDTQCRLVSLSGMTLIDDVDFFPLILQPKFSSEMFNEMTSDFGNHLSPATTTTNNHAFFVFTHRFRWVFSGDDNTL